MKRSEALNLRKRIEDAVQSLPGAAALEAVILHPVWKFGISYTVGYKTQHSGKLWRCLQAHTSQSGWEPENAVNTSLPAYGWRGWISIFVQRS